MSLFQDLEKHAEHMLNMFKRVVHQEEQAFGAANEQTKEIAEMLEKYLTPIEPVVEEVVEPVVEEIVEPVVEKVVEPVVEKVVEPVVEEVVEPAVQEVAKPTTKKSAK